MCLAVPGVLKILLSDDALLRSGVVDFGGVSREVNIACLPQAKVGDYIIVHAGVGLQILDEEEALKLLKDLEED